MSRFISKFTGWLFGLACIVGLAVALFRIAGNAVQPGEEARLKRGGIHSGKEGANTIPAGSDSHSVVLTSIMASLLRSELNSKQKS